MNREIRAEEELIEQPELSKGNEANKFDQSDTEEIGKELADEKLEPADAFSDIKNDIAEEKPLDDYPDYGSDEVLPIENVETKSNSAFSRENFAKENSFDTHAKEQYPELNELKNKCVYDTPPMGTNENNIDRSPKGEYTQEEIDYIKDAREQIDEPTSETVMQKVVGVDTGDIHKDLDRYLNPCDFSGSSCEAHVTGCVSKAEDAASFTKTPTECYENLRLDYPGTNYVDPEQSVYAIRYTNGMNYDIPYSQEFDGGRDSAAPMTGNGFTGSDTHVIPEYDVYAVNNKGAVVTDGEIYRINPNGTEEPVAYYDKKDRLFVLYEEESYQ